MHVVFGVLRKLGKCVAAVVAMAGMGIVVAQPTGASAAKTVITGFVASPGAITTLYGQSTVSATVANATTCSITSTPPIVFGAGPVTCSGGTVSQVISFPENTPVRHWKDLKYKLTLTAIGPTGTKKKNLTVTVNMLAGGGVAPSISSAATATLGAGHPDNFLVTATGGPLPDIGETGLLPAGLSFVDQGGGTALISGTPATDAVGTYPISITASNSHGPTETQAFTLVVVTPTPLLGVQSIATGAETPARCAVLTSGGVDCWGSGAFGELGDGMLFDSGTPERVSAVGGSGTLAGAVSLAGNLDSFCAVLASGGVDCWGTGQGGELGNGSNLYASAVPVQVVGVHGGTLSGVASVVSDSSQAYCGLMTSGGVDCWGAGYLGNNTGREGNTPVQVVGVSGSGALGGVTSIAAADETFCAVLVSGGVVCWGYGAHGELGNGTTNVQMDEPVQVAAVGGGGALSSVASLASTTVGFCAVLVSGGVDCWGDGANGELGDGASSSSSTPVQVVDVGGSGALGGVVALTGSFCAFLVSGGVDCWGYGAHGELGNGASSSSSTPVQVVDVGGLGALGGVVALTGEGDATCALMTSGGVDCWGGYLGNNTGASSSTPVQVVDVGGSGALGGVVALTGGDGSFCAVLASGGLDCWGLGGLGELGNGVPLNSDSPVEVMVP